MIHRTPPHSVDAEQGVLGSCLIAPRATISECIASQINESYFYTPAHQTVYRILLEMWGSGKAIDLITVTQELRDRNILDSVGGAAWVTSLFTFVPTAANVQYYIDIVRDKYILREIISASTQSVLKSYEEQDEVNELLEECQDRISKISTKNCSGRKSLSELVQEKLTRMERGDSDGEIIKTGITKLDEGSPLRKKDMPVISGEAKAGKTMLSLTIALNVARSGIPVAYISLESSSAEAVDRLLSGVSRIPMQVQDHVAKMNQGEIQRATGAAATLSGLPLYLYDDIFDLHHIIAEARLLKSQRNIGLIIVDYLQLVRSRVQKDRNREQEVAQISRALRLLALELCIPIIVLSQLNEDGRSRESRAIEQDTTAMWKFSKDQDEPNKHWIKVPFQRNGPPCKFPVTFLGSIGRIENFIETIPNELH